MKKQIELIISRLKEINVIIGTCSDGTIPFEQANVIARFYYDYQDTNALIDEAEKLATEDTGRLRNGRVTEFYFYGCHTFMSRAIKRRPY